MGMLFRVVAVSSNTNSFGLHGMVLFGQDGSAWEVGANSINVLKRGRFITLPDPQGQVYWASAGFEIPRKMPQPPESVWKKGWNLTAG